MTTQPEPDSLRDQLCDAFIRLIRDYADRSIIAPGYMADTALAVVQPVINEAQQRAEQIAAITTLAFDADLRPDVRLSRIRNLIDPADGPEGGAQ